MCFQIDESFGASREFMGMMPWDLFTSVVDQAVEHDCHAITLASRGEPTIHREFPQMLEYLHEKGVLDTKINTNATRLTEELSHQILRAEVSTVTFSVDAADKETYERIRVGGKFDEVLANIDNFNRIRDSDYPDSATTTRISGVAVENTQNPNEMQAFWSHRVDHVAIVPMNPRWDTYNNPLFNRTKSCGYLYERMYVWWDGTCNPCDFDYKSLLAVGDAKEDSLESIWKGPKFQRIRELHDQKLRSSLNPCDRCPL